MRNSHVLSESFILNLHSRAADKRRVFGKSSEVSSMHSGVCVRFFFLNFKVIP